MIKLPLKATALACIFALGSSFANAEETTSGEIALFLTVKTQPGQRDALVALWEKHLMTRAADDASHLSYVFALDLQDQDTVHITEVYKTQAAFQSNSQSDWFAAYMAEVGPLLAEEPAFAMASPYWLK